MTNRSKSQARLCWRTILIPLGGDSSRSSEDRSRGLQTTILLTIMAIGCLYRVSTKPLKRSYWAPRCYEALVKNYKVTFTLKS